jgi:hypothetical protein
VHGPLFAALTPGVRRILDGVPDLVDRVFPLPGRFRAGLPRDVAELSGAFTGSRGSRGMSYLGRPSFLSAYLRYFLPWNLYRLCRLLPGLPLSLKAGDTVTDTGAGPLTLPAALWIARPELRTLPLTFRCVDQTGAVLEAGKRFFFALLAAETGQAGQGANCPWKITTLRERWGSAAPRNRDRPPAALVTAVNFFNELYWDIPHTDDRTLRRFAENGARMLTAAAPAGAVLAVEPGVPRAGEFITALRDSLGALGYSPAAPCPHAGPCPLPGGRTGGTKRRWCHFTFDTGDAPPALLKLSAAAGLPKERAALSFLLAGPPGAADTVKAAGTAKGTDTPPGMPVRILSEIFPLPGGKSGRYGCSERGLVLAVSAAGAAAGRVPEKLCPGALLNVPPPQEPERRDPKSGALIIEHFPKTEVLGKPQLKHGGRTGAGDGNIHCPPLRIDL